MRHKGANKTYKYKNVFNTSGTGTSLIAMIVSAYAQAANDEQDMAKGWEKSVKGGSSLATALREWNELGFGVFIHWTPSVDFQSRYHTFDEAGFKT